MESMKQKVQVGSIWSFKSSSKVLHVKVNDIVDGPTPVVMYSIHEDPRYGMCSLNEFLNRYQPDEDWSV